MSKGATAWRIGLLGAAALAAGWVAGCAAPDKAPEGTNAAATADAVSAWVQYSAYRGWVVRALTADAACPELTWAGGRMALATRAAPMAVPPRDTGGQPDAKVSQFPLRSCEAPWPEGVLQARVGARLVNGPAPRIQRVLVLADTGCRMKQSENAFQDCNDPERWPFATIAAQAAKLKPDLVLHIGDLHYRESPCPAFRPGCAGSAWGYGDDAWQADFFVPAAPLLASAPWLVVRGNHESCQRAGVGWYRYFDGYAPSATRHCIDPAHDDEGEFTPPFAFPMGVNEQWLVFDSAYAASRAYRGDERAFARYAEQLRAVQALAAKSAHNLFLNHHPVLGFGGSAQGQAKPGHVGLQSVMQTVFPGRLFAPQVDAVLNGHVHLFEALDFASDHPAALVLGNAGSAMEGRVSPASALASEPAPGAKVKHFATQDGFGFATLDRTAQGWHLTEWNDKGQPVVQCDLQGAALACQPH